MGNMESMLQPLNTAQLSNSLHIRGRVEIQGG